MAIPRVQEKSVRAVKRWRVATIKIQAAQRFAKMVHLPEEEKLQLGSVCFSGSRQSQLLRQLTPLDEVFQGSLTQTTKKKTAAVGSYEGLLKEARSVGLARSLQHKGLGLKEKEKKKSLYYWDFCTSTSAITPLAPQPLQLQSTCNSNQGEDQSYRSKSVAKRTVSEDAFDAIRIVGSGSSGQVYLVRDRVNGGEFAMKVMNKVDVIAKQRSERVLLEKEILCKMNKHRLFTNLIHAFHTSSDSKPWQSRFFLVLEYCKHGNLHEVVVQHLQRKHNLLTSEELSQCLVKASSGDGLGLFKTILGKKREQPRVALPRSCVKLVLSEVALALDALHSVGYAFRDLKPQNVLLHEDGHIRLGDFGVAKVISHKAQGAHRTSTFVGTLEYMAPEIVAGDSQYAHVDWWAYGILAYELLYGETPFKSKIDCKSGNCQKDLFFSIMEPEKIEYPSIPGQRMRSLVQLIQRQLRVNPQKRLNIAQVRSSQYFRSIKWDTVLEGKGPGKHMKANNSLLTRSVSTGWPGKLGVKKLDSLLRRQKSSNSECLDIDTSECSSENESSEATDEFHSGLTLECRSKSASGAQKLCFAEFQWSHS